MPEPHKRKSSLKNFLILGAVGIGGFLTYKYFKSSAGKVIAKTVKSAASGKPQPAGPDINGPSVTKFEIASTETKTCISTPVKGMVYAPISSYNATTGYNTFSSTANGHFTRRLLCVGSKRWAEIYPTPGLGEFIDVGFERRVDFRAP